MVGTGANQDTMKLRKTTLNGWKSASTDEQIHAFAGNGDDGSLIERQLFRRASAKRKSRRRPRDQDQRKTQYRFRFHLS